MSNKRNKHNRSSFQEQLGSLTGKHDRVISPRQVSSRRLPAISALPPCGSWQGDGVDHINIDTTGKVELGVAMTLKFHLPFTHDVFGKFKSMSELWQAIDDYMGSHAIYSNSVNLPLIMADGLWQRVKQYPKLEAELKASTLPFDMYSYGVTDLPSRRPVSYWWLEAVERVRSALKADAEKPDFTVMQRNGIDLEEVLRRFVETYIPNRRSTEEPKVETKGTLVNELRKSVPVKMGTTRKFSMSIKPPAGVREKDEKIPSVADKLPVTIKTAGLDAEKVGQLFAEAAPSLTETLPIDAEKNEGQQVPQSVKDLQEMQDKEEVKEETPALAPAAVQADMTIEEMFATGNTGEINLQALVGEAPVQENVVETATDTEELVLCTPETEAKFKEVITSSTDPVVVSEKLSALLMADPVFVQQLTAGATFAEELESATHCYTVNVYEGVFSMFHTALPQQA